MRTYIEFVLKKFQNQMAYKLEFFMGIINTVITIFVFCSIYKALYSGAQTVDNVSFAMVATSFVISLGLSNAFSFNEMFLQDKLRDGTITGELLKPVNFKFRMLAENIGSSMFNIIFNFVPALIFSMIYMDLCAPGGIVNFMLMFISIVLGYLILWLISFIIQTWSFWLFSVWGIVTIKNVFVNILSGTMLPIWFMPDMLKKIVQFTPFYYIYFAPVRIYLGELNGMKAVNVLVLQIMWIIILYFIGSIFWKNGIRKLVVQGG